MDRKTYIAKLEVAMSIIKEICDISDVPRKIQNEFKKMDNLVEDIKADIVTEKNEIKEVKNVNSQSSILR